MAKLVLGKRPKDFKRTINIQMLDGTTGSVECTFKYRTRKEFGEFIDAKTAATLEAVKAETEAVKAETEAGKPDEGKAFSLKDHLEQSSETSAAYILDIVTGWNLDVELSLQSLQDLANEFPGAPGAIIEMYRAAIVDGRLGN